MLKCDCDIHVQTTILSKIHRNKLLYLLTETRSAVSASDSKIHVAILTVSVPAVSVNI